MDYVKLSEMPVKYDLLGCCVELLHIILLKETFSGKVVAQLQFRNISDLSIKSLYVSIRCYNEMGDILNDETPFEFVYQDLTAGYGEKFGDRIPVSIPDEHTRKIDVCIEKYMLADGSIHDKSEFKKVDLPEGGNRIPKHIIDVFEKTEQSSKYKTRFPKTIYPYIVGDCWVCSCGKFNRTDICGRCRLGRGQLSFITPENLEECFEKNREEKLKIEATKRKKQRKIGITVGSATALISIVLLFTKWLVPYVIVPKMNAEKYERASYLEEIEDFDLAYQLFLELGDYADSTERVVNFEEYTNACKLLKKEKYQEAYEIFKRLDDYRDSEVKAEEAYEHLKTGEFTETKTITVGTSMGSVGVYHPARSRTENVEAKVTMLYTNGIPNTKNAVIEFTGYQYEYGKWKEAQYYYVGEFNNGSITGYGKLYATIKTQHYLIYYGEFEDGVFSGIGNTCRVGGNVFLSGFWKNGNIAGDYTRYNASGNVYDRGYVENEIVYSDKYGEEDNSNLMPKTWPNSVNQ